MILTRSPYRPNIRRITSKQAHLRTFAANVAAGLLITGSLWTLLFIYVTR